MDYVKALHDIAIELVSKRDKLEVRQMPSLEEDTVVVYTSIFSLRRTYGTSNYRTNCEYAWN